MRALGDLATDRRPVDRSWGSPLAKAVGFRPITKGTDVAGYERVVTGVVLEPTTITGADAQGDVYSAAAVEAACHSFAEDAHFQLGLQHVTMASSEQAHVLESWIQRGDATIGGQAVVSGSWLISVRLDPEIFAKVLDGSFSGFSISGKAIRTPVGGASS